MKYPYGKIDKLAQSLAANQVDPATIELIMRGGDRVKQTDKNEKKAAWLLHAMEALDSELGPELRHKVREDCACCLGGKRNEICKQIHKSLPDTASRIQAANEAKLVFGNGVREKATGLYEVSFFDDALEKKPCPCVRGLDEAMPITYCYCCGGHVRHHLETVLGKKLSVKVLETALSTLGKKGCRFELREIKG
jgi:hypothetical protein